MNMIKKIHRGFSIIKNQGVKGLKTAMAKKVLSRQSVTTMWQGYQSEAFALVDQFDFSQQDLVLSRTVQAENPGEAAIHSVTWFIPDFRHAYYGGMHTILRFADFMARQKGVKNQFALLGSFDEKVIAGKIGEAFPTLQGSPVVRVSPPTGLAGLKPTDVSIATLWSTAYPALKFNQVGRKFYFIQDFEPLFYPAGSTQAQVEATYSFGFDGLCNTPPLAQIYREQYHGLATSFNPCVDPKVFNAIGRNAHKPGTPWQVFFYARPEHPRNGFELGIAALKKLKHRLGEHVRIVCAGDAWDPESYGLKGIIENLGLISYEKTGDLYRACDAGLVMMFTRHPSYLPFELMACGCCVVSNRNPWTGWFLKDGENCLLSDASATSLADCLEESLINEDLRQKIVRSAREVIENDHQDWDREFEQLFAWMRMRRD